MVSTNVKCHKDHGFTVAPNYLKKTNNLIKSTYIIAVNKTLASVISLFFLQNTIHVVPLNKNINKNICQDYYYY